MDPYCIPLRPHALTTPERVRVLGTGLREVGENSLVFAINAISQAMARFVRRPLHQVTTPAGSPELLQGYSRATLQLRCYPVVEIVSVEVSGSPVTDFSRNPQFLQDGQLYREVGWPMSAPRYNDLTEDCDTSRPRYNIAVSYTGGYVTPAQDLELGEPLPDEIELALFREIGDLLSGARNTGRIRREKTAGGYEVEFAMSGTVSLSRESQDVLSGYAWAGLP